MSAKQLYSKEKNGEFKPQSAYYCTKCGVIHREYDFANECCTVRKCECGNDLPRGWSFCSTCSAKKDSDKWHKSPIVEYKGGPVVTQEGIFYADMDDFLDSIDGYQEDEFVHKVELCDVVELKHKVHPTEILSDIEERFCEYMDDAHIDWVGKEAFLKQFQSFLDKQTYARWDPSGKLVKVPKIGVRDE